MIVKIFSRYRIRKILLHTHIHCKRERRINNWVPVYLLEMQEKSHGPFDHFLDREQRKICEDYAQNYSHTSIFAPREAGAGLQICTGVGYAALGGL